MMRDAFNRSRLFTSNKYFSGRQYNFYISNLMIEPARTLWRVPDEDGDAVNPSLTGSTWKSLIYIDRSDIGQPEWWDIHITNDTVNRGKKANSPLIE